MRYKPQPLTTEKSLLVDLSPSVQLLEVAKVAIEVTGLYAPFIRGITMTALIAVVITVTAKAMASFETANPRLGTALCWT